MYGLYEIYKFLKDYHLLWIQFKIAIISRPNNNNEYRNQFNWNSNHFEKTFAVLYKSLITIGKSYGFRIIDAYKMCNNLFELESK
jgi:hypothetical protein